MSHIAKIIWAADEQIVHLPADYFSDGEEVEIGREGDAIVLRPLANSLELQAKRRDAICQRP